MELSERTNGEDERELRCAGEGELGSDGGGEREKETGKEK